MLDMLKELNFNNLLVFDTSIKDYSYTKYIENGKKHPPLKKFCTSCEEKGLNICQSDRNYTLKAIGHGATTDDILLATNQQDSNISDWKKDRVMLLLENPGPASSMYDPVTYNGWIKYPTREWYWVNQLFPQKSEYPLHFQGEKYAEFFCSIVFTFKLRNMYITDLVKCGMNDSKKGYKSISKYDPKCVINCIDNYLVKEIDIIRPKIVFCFGHSVEKHMNRMKAELENMLGYSFIIEYLPHPAANRSFTPNEFEAKYITKITQGLFNVGIIDLSEKNYFDQLAQNRLGTDFIQDSISNKKHTSTLDEIRLYFERNGYFMRSPHNNYIASKPKNGLSFCVDITKNGVGFHWANAGSKDFPKSWFDKKLLLIRCLYPNSFIEVGTKNVTWVRLFIPVKQDNFLESLLDIANKTKRIMMY